MFIFAEVLADLLARYRHCLAVVGPELVDSGLTAQVDALWTHNVLMAEAFTA